MDTQVIGGWITVVFIAVCLVGLIAVHILPTGLNPLRDPVSQYHLGRYRPVILISTIAAAVAGIGAIMALNGMLGAAALVTSVLLAIFAASRALIPFLRMDPPGTPVTPIGRIHNILAFGAFGSAIAAAYVAGGALHDAGFATQAMWSTIFGVVGSIGAVGLLVCVVTKRHGLFGFFERLIYVGFIAWFLMIGFTAISA